MTWRAGCMAAAALAVVLTGCGKKDEPAAATQWQTKDTSAEEVIIIEPEETQGRDEGGPGYYLPEERVEKDGKIRSYLTGELVDLSKGNRRPVAVMISNDKEASPQYGINRAGVVYEAPVEGGIVRYMAVLEDYDDLDRIGSVRSCRTYYTYFAREFDAIYAHFGQSTFAIPYLKNVDDINGIEGIGGAAFYRTKDRKMPHNAYTSYERLQKSIEKLGFSQEYDSSYQGHFRFARTGRDVILEEDKSVPAYKVLPGYSVNRPWFTYNEKDGLYYRYQFGAPHNGSEGQIAVKNIILQYCPTGFYATTEYLDINVHANESGYYITGGRAVPVRWEKDGEFGVTHYYDMEDNEIILNQGKTWICIIPSKDFSKTELYGKE